MSRKKLNEKSSKVGTVTQVPIEKQIDITKMKTKTLVRQFRLFDFQVVDADVSTDDSGSDTSTHASDTSHTKKPQKQFHIQMFGINERGTTCALTVHDFQPFFFVKVGDDWTQHDANELLKRFQRETPGIIKSELVKYHELYGFTAGKKSKFVQLTFQTASAMSRIKQLWYKSVTDPITKEKTRVRQPYRFNDQVLELYESHLPPLLRYFHIHNVSPTGWIQFKVKRATPVYIKQTTCTHEYRISLQDVDPLPEKETLVPFKICSFDIEASSSHGDFPRPIKDYKRLATQLVDVVLKQQRVMSLTPDKCAGLVKKVVLTAFTYDTCDDVDVVYPKKAPSQEEVMALFPALLDYNVHGGPQNAERHRITTIASLFQGMADTAAAAGSGDEGDGGDAEEVEEVETPRPRIQVTPCPHPGNACSLLHVLCQTEKEGSDMGRDDKINHVNDALTDLFPPLEGDNVTFIGSTFVNYGGAEPYLNHCLVVSTCDPVPNVEVVAVTNERDLLLQWAELIQREDPDIIIGYNIFGFDYEFMFRRAQELECDTEFLRLSRQRGEVCANVVRDTQERQLNNTKIVLATGEYDLNYPAMTGRLQIDMYTYFRRDFNLSSYKLDDVAGQFISDDVVKYEVEDGGVVALYTHNVSGLHGGDYLHLELCGFTSDYLDDGRKFPVVSVTPKGEEGMAVVRIAGPITLAPGTKLRWCMAKDDVSPQDIFRLTRGSAADRAKVAKYCIQDCNLVHHLFQKLDVLTGYVEMSRICSVPISFLVFRGQGIKLTSFVAKKCREKATLMPDLDKGRGDNDGYEGAIVLPPKCAIYMDNPVACVDYSSLYPSSMISQNLSHDSKVWTKEYNAQGALVQETGKKNKKGEFMYDNLPGYEYIDITFDTFKYRSPKAGAKAVKTKVGHKVVRWAQFPSGQKAIMPAILEELLRARSDTRKLIKTVSDPFIQNILDKRQLGYKVTANSLYGQCGAKTSTFYEKDVAASTTATGRMMIVYAKTMIEQVYGNHVYDTQGHGPVLTKAEYVYGDSVANYTPVYVRYQGKVHVCSIDTLAARFGDNRWSVMRDGVPGGSDKECCELPGVDTWTEQGWTPLCRVIRHALAPHKRMFRVVTSSGIVDVTDDHSLLNAVGAPLSTKECAVGTALLHHSLPPPSMTQERMKTQLAKYLGSLASKVGNGMMRLRVTNPINAAKIVYYAQGLGFHTSLTIDQEDPTNPFSNTPVHPVGVYVITISMMPLTANPVLITHLRPLTSYYGYVYDLTTDNHHFAAGIGNIVVHNTDSVFFTFNLQDPQTGEDIRGKKALEITIEIAQDAAHLCSDYLKAPMELSYEKTLMPFILLSKKRYVGMLYETNPNKGKLKYMGLSLKRRDSCDYLKDVYGGILTILMDDTQTVHAACAFLDRAIRQLIDGQVPMEKLAVTKALRGYYKNPEQIAHHVLATRIGKRDPGNKPKPGDRMKFVHIVSKNKHALQGEKIETPEFIRQHGLPIDYTFYITNQLMKPLQQLFGLALEQIWANKRAGIEHRRDLQRLQKEFPDTEVYMKKREKLCSQKVKALLFDKYLTEIQQKQTGQRQLCFGSVIR